MGQEGSFLDSRGCGEAKAAGQLSHMDLVGLEYPFEEVVSEVVDEGAVGIEAGPVEVIVLFDKLPELIVDA